MSLVVENFAQFFQSYRHLFFDVLGMDVETAVLARPVIGRVPLQIVHRGVSDVVVQRRTGKRVEVAAPDGVHVSVGWRYEGVRYSF